MQKSISPKVGVVIIGVVVVVAAVVGYKATAGGSKVTTPQSMSNFMGKDKAAPPNLQGAGRQRP